MTRADQELDRGARALCREKCAHMGEPPCWQIDSDHWPNPLCNDPGCHIEAGAVIDAIRRGEIG